MRGSVDGWDFKSYVLGILFYRFISENLRSHINNAEWKVGNTDFDYAKISDEEAEYGRKDTVAEKGSYILPSELFINVQQNAESFVRKLYLMAYKLFSVHNFIFNCI